MEAPEQVMGSHSSSSTGECPSPPSPPPPPPPTATTTTTTPSPAAVAPFKRKRTKLLRSFPTNFPSSSSTSSLEQLPNAADATTTTTTEEEEDMAHCLILLAQGRALQSPPPPSGTQTPVVTPTEKFTSRKFSETVTTAGGKAGFYVYECKTCNKCFPSFQALGGHRASHKKPKNMTVSMTDFEDKKQQLSIGGDHLQDHHHQIQIQDGGGDVNMMNMNMNMKAVVVSSPNSACKVQRVHECSICGAEFSSGQALGGHMRRHRPIIQAGHESQHVKKENSAASSNNNLQNSHNNSNVLTLDLNLPAPSEDLNSATTTEAFRPMVFSSALVDCHY